MRRFQGRSATRALSTRASSFWFIGNIFSRKYDFDSYGVFHAWRGRRHLDRCQCIDSVTGCISVSESLNAISRTVVLPLEPLQDTKQPSRRKYHRHDPALDRWSRGVDDGKRPATKAIRNLPRAPLSDILQLCGEEKQL
jgi:hypothetical protein